MSHAPGTYLTDQREAAGMTLLDVALRIETIPAVAASVRVDWLRAIEGGLAPVRLSTALALHAIPELRIDLSELARLADQAETLVHFMPALTLDAVA